MPTIEFVPSGGADPRHAQFAILEHLLAARVRNDVDLAEVARQRVDVNVIDRLNAHGFKSEELTFIISPRTLAHRRQKNERLSAEQSDRAIRLARIVAQADSAFGGQEKAVRWLRSAQARFAGRSALEMTGTEHGARLVEEALVEIDEGYFA